MSDTGEIGETGETGETGDPGTAGGASAGTGRGVGSSVGSDDSGAAMHKLAEVQRRLNEIRTHKRGAVRWTVSSHTAELAIGAIAGDGRRKSAARRGKTRRRKRTKRLL